MGKIKRDEILESCVAGIEKSFKEYLRWSYDEWLWNAPEYLLTVNIAKKLSKIKSNAKFITLEDNVRATLKNAWNTSKGRLNSRTRPNGRIDIVFWWGKGTPRGIIEVKNGIFNKNDIQEDLDRIYNILDKESDLEFGVTTFYIDRHYEKSNPKEKIETRIKEDFIKEIQNEIGDKYKIRHIHKCIKDEKNDAAYAVAIMICK